MWANTKLAVKLLKINRKTFHDWIKFEKVNYKRNLANTGYLIWIPDDYFLAPDEENKKK